MSSMNQLEGDESRNKASSLALDIKNSILGRNNQLSRLIAKYESCSSSSSSSSSRALDRYVMSEDARRLGFSSENRDQMRVDRASHMVNDVNYQNPNAIALMRRCFGIDTPTSYSCSVYEPVDSWDYKRLAGETYDKNPRFQRSQDDGYQTQLEISHARAHEKTRALEAKFTDESNTKSNDFGYSIDEINKYVFDSEVPITISGYNDEIDIRKSIVIDEKRDTSRKIKNKKSSKKSSSKKTSREKKKKRKHKEKKEKREKKKRKSKKRYDSSESRNGCSSSSDNGSSSSTFDDDCAR